MYYLSKVIVALSLFFITSLLECAAGFHPLVGNGVCNDITNIPECEFDGSDCCISPVIKDHCSNCQCLGKLNKIEIADLTRKTMSLILDNN